MKKYILQLILLISFAVWTSSCTKENTVIPDQIITNDTSSNSGRLIAKMYDQSSNFVGNADAYLYADYDDVLRGLPLLKVTGNSAGDADFGFVLIGNYYIVASKNTGSGTIADTCATQVLSQRTTNRVMILN